jgi:hypothetical protein
VIFFFLLFLFAPPCFAVDQPTPVENSVSKPRVLVHLGAAAFAEEDAMYDRYEVRIPWLVRGGWIFDKGDAFYEYSRFTVTTGEGAITIRRIQHIQMLWYRHWLEKRGEFVPYIAGAVGAQASSIKTDFGAQTIKSNGENELALGLATGAFTMLSDLFETGIEFRLLASETFRPNLAIGATVFFGIRL